MPYTNSEKQRRFKERMYNAGLKQTILWVKREGAKRNTKMTQAEFVKSLKKLTAGWDGEKLAKLYSLLLKITKGKKEAYRLKEKK